MITAVIVMCYLMAGVSCQKTTCRVQGRRADCSHLSLAEVPPNLPSNLISLDLSHNRLRSVSSVSLAPYPGLQHLNISYNSISKLDSGLCQTLPLLQTLNIQHNQVLSLKYEHLSHCTNLTQLTLASNMLRLKGDPFSALQSLKFLDVSKNKLPSAKLGSQPQLPNLVNLNLALNDFTTLKKDDFAFLNQSSFLEVLNFTSLSLKKLERGCFKLISNLRTLIMDRSTIAPSVFVDLCSELSGTAINALSLRNMKLISLTNTTFLGLKETNLTILDLSYNSIGKIEKGSFQWLPKLETLNLMENNIKHITKDTFQGLKSLKKLQLTRALVKSHTSSTPIIDDFSFQPLSALESLILHRTEVREITEHTFTGLTSLKELDMSWSRYSSLKNITNKTFASLAGSPLRKLYLTGTDISQINPGSFSSLGNLTILYLDSNFIKQTLSGREFEGLGQVQELYMSSNSINSKINLTSNSFVHLPSLRVLTLGRTLTPTSLNQDQSPFSPLTNLTLLDLSNNNLANIRENTFKGLVNLKVLKLQHNNLARLWKRANLGGPVLFLKEVPNLKTLLMDSNGLDEVPEEALRGLKDLRELSLANNLLNNLKDSIFDDLESLQALYLQRNMITNVRPEVFKTPFSNITLLVMGKNPFDCTCESILWFVKWLNNTNVTNVSDISEPYLCNTPLHYFNHTITDFDALSCKDMTPFQALYILSSTTVVMLIVSALLVRFHGWRIRFYWNIMINRTLGFSDATIKEDREYEFDAYVIHAENDSSWVERRLVPLENENCKFCLEDRDSIAGLSQLESIVNNIRNSRKILFVVTESLLRDPWCRRFTAHQALHQVIEASRDSVVLVFLQDIHDYRLFRTLFLRRGMLRSSCILHWPIHKERVSAFHQKLLIALGMTNHLQD